MAKMKTVEFPPGTKHEGLDLGLESSTEPWSVYELSNGGTLRAKIILAEAVLTGVQSPTGEPLVVVKANMVINYDGPTLEQSQKKQDT